jgi:hypothetical protein
MNERLSLQELQELCEVAETFLRETIFNTLEQHNCIEYNHFISVLCTDDLISRAGSIKVIKEHVIKDILDGLVSILEVTNQNHITKLFLVSCGLSAQLHYSCTDKNFLKKHIDC